MGAGARQFGFMLRGLKLLEPELAKLGIPFFLLKGKPEDTLPKLCKDAKAALLVADQSPMKLARSWRTKVRSYLRCGFRQQAVVLNVKHSLQNLVPAWHGVICAHLSSLWVQAMQQEDDVCNGFAEPLPR